MKITSIIAVLAFAFVANAQEGAAPVPPAHEGPHAAAPAPMKKKGHAAGKKAHKKGHDMAPPADAPAPAPGH